MPRNEKADGAHEAEVEAHAAAADHGAAPEAHHEEAREEAAAPVPEIPRGVGVMRHPLDPKASASHDGETFEADEHGYLVVPHAAIEPLKSHGFELVKKG